MNKRYLPTLVFAAMISVAATAQVNPRDYAAKSASVSDSLLQRTESWGSWDESPEVQPEDGPKPTQVIYYNYDNNNTLVSAVTVTNLLTAGGKMTTGVDMYHYDEDGKLLNVTQRKSSDGVTFGDATVSERYAYNEDGQLVYQYAASGRHAYKWEGKNMVEQSDTSSYTKQWSTTYFYSDFKEGVDNLPQTVYSVSKWSKYKCVYTYDEQNRPVTYTQYQITKATVDPDTHALSDIVVSENPYMQTTWTYDSKGVTSEVQSYWNSGKAALVPSSRTTYTTLEDGGREMRNASYNASKDTWSNYGSPARTYYDEFTKDSAPRNLQYTQKEGALNVAQITADAPAGAKGDERWDIYRNGVCVGDTVAVDGKINFEDVTLPNGTYLYYIQQQDSVSTHNVSNVLEVELEAPLNAPTNLRVTKAEKSYNKSEDAYYWNLTLEWDKPAEQEGITLESYNVYADLAYNADPEALNINSLTGKLSPIAATKTSYTAKIEADGDYHTLYVEAVYKDYGEITSQGYAVKCGSTPEKVLYTRSQLGDVLGEGSDDKASKVTTYFYNEKNQLVREVNKGLLMGDNPDTQEVEKAGDYQVTSYVAYTYDENGNLLTEVQAQYKVNQGYQLSWTTPDTITTYKYDANNNCIEKKDDTKTYAYAWDGKNLISEKQIVTSTGGWLFTQTYSDFVEGQDNLPQRAVKDGQYSSNQRVIEMTYDAAGRMLTRTAYKFGEVQRADDNTIISATKGDADIKEEWTYNENGDCTQYLKSKWNTKSADFVPSSKTDYTYSADGNTMTEVTSSYNTYGEAPSWTAGRPYVNVYKESYEGSPITTFTVEKDAEKVNTVNISAKISTDNWDCPTYNVYRNGQYIGEATFTNARYTAVSFTDYEVPNGTWDYYLQADNTLSNVTVNVPTPVTVVFNTELQPVTNIHQTTATKDNSYYTLSLAWDAPETPYNLIGYNVYQDVKSFTKNPAPVNGSEFIASPAYDLEWSVEGEAETNVIVEAVYTIGRIKSEAVPFNMSELTGIDEASNIAADVNFSLSGRTLRVNGNYGKLSVYAVSGALCGEYAGAESVNLNTLPSGVYVVKATGVDGKQIAKKLILE